MTDTPLAARPLTAPLATPRFTGAALTCIRGERVVFAGLDFALAPGEALVLTGRNGSGKSSLLRVMAGLVRPAAGALAWDGVPVSDDPEAHGGRTRYLGHLDAVKPALTVAENILSWVRLWAPALSRPEAGVAQALDQVGLAHLGDVPGRYLSAGQKRRVNLARLFAAPADLWLLDEPTTALDRASIAMLEATLAAHRAAGGMVVLSTHAEVALPGARALRLEDFAFIPPEDDVEEEEKEKEDMPA